MRVYYLCNLLLPYSDDLTRAFANKLGVVELSEVFLLSPRKASFPRHAQQICLASTA